MGIWLNRPDCMLFNTGYWRYRKKGRIYGFLSSESRCGCWQMRPLHSLIESSGWALFKVWVTHCPARIGDRSRRPLCGMQNVEINVCSQTVRRNAPETVSWNTMINTLLYIFCNWCLAFWRWGHFYWQFEETHWRSHSYTGEGACYQNYHCILDVWFMFSHVFVKNLFLISI
jgi:hypothetical protein